MGVRFGWLITADHSEVGEASSVGVCGPSLINHSVESELRAGSGTEFRLYDDDDKLYFTGRMISDGSEGQEFSPLDDFGGPGFGCTRLDVKNGNKWETV